MCFGPKSLVVVMVASVALSAPAAAQTVRDIANRGACSTSGVEGLSAQLAEFQSCMRPGQFVRFAPHAGISLSSSRVHPYLQTSARDALWQAASGGSLTINSAFRTLADQYVLYHSGGCGLAARPGRSNHQSGRAVDVQNYSSAKSRLQGASCSWLGSSDPVHFDCPGSDLRNDTILAFQRLWNVNNPSDRIAEDGSYGPATESRLGRSPAGGFSNTDCGVTEPTEPMDPMDPMDPVDPPVTPPTTPGGEAIGVVFHDTGAGLADTSQRLVGATIRVLDTGTTQTSDAMGMWRFALNAGRYTIEASMEGYHTQRVFCDVATTGQAWCSVGLSPTTSAPPPDPIEPPDPVSPPMMEPAPAGAGVLQGVVYEGTVMTRVPGVTVTVLETSEARISATGTGEYLFNLQPGNYTLQAQGPGVSPVTRSCAVVSAMTTWCSVAIVRTTDDLGTVTNTEPIPDSTNPFAGADGGVGPGTAPTRTSSAVSSGCSAGGTPPAAHLGWLMLALLPLRRRK